ncbi:DUF6232 family protein [Microcoleus sp. LAD1_D5]|uniref:DUF6232 family protein n=1 Tax=unclassified Microcoleus TaxID=2642155 RepID=UPI002FD71368
MATPNPLGSNQSITLERNKVITITKRTVRFSYNVYQTHNITGFSEGEVDIGTIPWGIIIVFLLGSSIVGMGNSGVGGLLGLVAIGGAIWNVSKPKHYGLLLTLNSGDQKLFTTKQKESLKQVIGVIYEFIESEKEATYQISISNSEVSGNFIQGNVGGSTSYLFGD